MLQGLLWLTTSLRLRNLLYIEYMILRLVLKKQQDKQFVV